jgi:hypothetical protein
VEGFVSKQLHLFGAKFDQRFFEDYVGKAILHDPKVALIELIANAWDASATEVRIVWSEDGKKEFSIQDNGCGLTESDFEHRWMTLSYNRQDEIGKYAEPLDSTLEEDGTYRKRLAFGRNGKGRHSGFCFSADWRDGYYVETARKGKKSTFRVYVPSTGDAPVKSEKIFEEVCPKSGTKIYVKKSKDLRISANEICSEVSMRFLADPKFSVWINGTKITFDHIPQGHITNETVWLKGGSSIEIVKIDVRESDRTTRQHGIAWQVNGRLVGNVDWKSLGDQSFIDGRKAAAKRFSFIVKADCLADFVEADWTGFKSNDPFAREALEKVSARIKGILLETSKEQREETFTNILRKNNSYIRDMGEKQKSMWATFVKRLQEECPNLSERDVDSVASVLAKLESSKSKYGLLNKLHECSIEDVDTLDEILENWTVETAKIVLDALEERLKLIDELSKKVHDRNTDEVHELQPLFAQGLWIFGPEYEAAGFTSNKGMTTVIKDIFGRDDLQGTRNRPDFVITPDSSVGFYDYPSFDTKTGSENGVARLVILELKKPGVSLGSEEKEQCWKYVKELREKGLIGAETSVDCYVMGMTIKPYEGGQREEGKNTIIRPVTYDTVLRMAKRRTHRLYEKIKESAPFLKEKADEELSITAQEIEVNNETTTLFSA